METKGIPLLPSSSVGIWRKDFFSIEIKDRRIFFFSSFFSSPPSSLDGQDLRHRFGFPSMMMVASRAKMNVAQTRYYLSVRGATGNTSHRRPNVWKRCILVHRGEGEGGRGEEVVVSYIGERRGIGRTRDVDGIHSGNAYLITTDWTILRSCSHGI